jgi:hypothetical protein
LITPHALAGETDYFIKTVENRSDKYWEVFAIAKDPGYLHEPA